MNEKTGMIEMNSSHSTEIPPEAILEDKAGKKLNVYPC